MTARHHYGPDPNQFGDLRLPDTHGASPSPVVVVIHGGFWRAAYGLEHIRPLCEALTRAGAATWSLEYRRLGQPGGGWPGTLEDIVAGFDHLRTLSLDLRDVVVTGHSAGGHLALWLASQRPDALRGVVPLGGVADLRLAWELRLSNNVIEQFLGGPPHAVPERYRIPGIAIPQRLIHGTRDDIVPIEVARRYIETAHNAKLIPLEGAGHFEPADPGAREWPIVRDTIFDLLRGSRESCESPAP